MSRLRPDPEVIPVRAKLWGETEADQERALDCARRSPWRNGWDFVEVERRDGSTCPLDLKDPKALAAEQGYGWAYVVYRMGGAR